MRGWSGAEGAEELDRTVRFLLIFWFKFVIIIRIIQISNL
jgi:hypothetical protein